MTTTVTNFRKNIYNLMENTIHYNEPIHVTTRIGNAVVLSEEEYNSMVETLYLTSVPGMREKLLEGLHTPLADTVPEDEVAW